MKAATPRPVASAPLDLDRRVLIVAEIGNNHEGDPDLAAEMVRRAAGAGADAVKFQTIVPERLVSPLEPARLAQLQRLRLLYESFEDLSRIAATEGVLFLSTPFDIDSARFLEPLVPAFKIASGDNNFYPLLDTVANTGKPILLSTGMADAAVVRQAADRIRGIWAGAGVDPGLVLLHCVSSYPTPPERANLGAIRALAELADYVGYSDHTLGTEAAVLSVALGARVVEKHFTLDRNYSDFRDHSLSADPREFADLVQRIRKAETLLGDGTVRVRPEERAMAEPARRSIVARRDLSRGDVLVWEDLDWLRPGAGLQPGQEGDLIGKRLVRAVERGSPIAPDDVTASELAG